MDILIGKLHEVKFEVNFERDEVALSNQMYNPVKTGNINLVVRESGSSFQFVLPLYSARLLLKELAGAIAYSEVENKK